MKKAILLFIFLIFFTTLSAQIKPLEKVSILFRDGTVLNGYGKFRAMLPNKIVYKETKNSRREVYDYRTVKRLIIYSDMGEQFYEYKMPRSLSSTNVIIRLYEVVQWGKINLYQYLEKSVSSTPIYPFDAGYSETKYDEYFVYFISEDRDSDFVKFFSYRIPSRRFKKVAKQYFSSCPELLKKINKGDFDQLEIPDVIAYYNKKCD